MVRAGARQPSEADSSSSLPMRASTGSAARWWPAAGGEEGRQAFVATHSLQAAGWGNLLNFQLKSSGCKLSIRTFHQRALPGDTQPIQGRTTPARALPHPAASAPLPG